MLDQNKMILCGSEYFGNEVHTADLEYIHTQEDNDSFITIGKFEGDWDGEIYTALSMSHKRLMCERTEFSDYVYELMLDDSLTSVLPKISKMADILGFEKGYTSYIHTQRPGCVIPQHADDPNFTGLPLELQNQGVKVTIMLAPWEFGQLFAFKNSFYQHWEAGTIIYSDFEKTKHFTCNASSHSRPMLVITGLPNNTLRKIIDDKKFCVFKI